MSKPGPQQVKSQRARDAICAATIDLLAETGYAETSLNRVAASAGFSKGALQHHFPTKEDLIAATVDVLLSRTITLSVAKKPPETVEQALAIAWYRFIDTEPYRALMEVLTAARTDKTLRKRLGPDLVHWGKILDEQTLDTYEAVSGDDGEAAMLLKMTRSFMHGLLVQEAYGTTREQNRQYVDKWIELVAPMLKLRGKDD